MKPDVVLRAQVSQFLDPWPVAGLFEPALGLTQDPREIAYARELSLLPWDAPEGSAAGILMGIVGYFKCHILARSPIQGTSSFLLAGAEAFKNLLPEDPRSNAALQALTKRPRCPAWIQLYAKGEARLDATEASESIAGSKKGTAPMDGPRRVEAWLVDLWAANHSFPAPQCYELLMPPLDEHDEFTYYADSR